MKSITKQAYRTAAEQGENSWFGAGVMKKRDVKNDETNSVFNFFSLVYVKNGEGIYYDEDSGKTALSPGSVFLRIPGLKHSTILNSDKDWDECYIDLSFSYYKSFKTMGIINPQSSVLTCPASFSLAGKIDLLITKIEKSNDKETPDRLLDCINLIRAIINQKKESTLSETMRKMVEKSCEDFDNYYTSRFNLKNYCIQNGYGYESFRKIFRQTTDMSPGQYLLKRRMEAACCLLKDRDRAISQIAEELGYRSPFEFSAQFKRYMGLSPRRFQRGYV